MLTLFLKEWRGSRARLLLGFLAIVSWCIVAVGLVNRPSPTPSVLPYARSVWAGFYSSTGPMIFLAIAGLLGLGGLKSERLTGTLLLTLSLPLTRIQLYSNRLLAGLTMVVLVAILPVLTLPLLSLLFGRTDYSLLTPALFLPGFLICGFIMYCFGFLVASIFENDLTGGGVILAAIPLYRMLTETVFHGSRGAHPIAIMSAVAAPLQHLQSGSPLPAWSPDQVLPGLIAALVMLAVSAFLHSRLEA